MTEPRLFLVGALYFRIGTLPLNDILRRQRCVWFYANILPLTLGHLTTGIRQVNERSIQAPFFITDSPTESVEFFHAHVAHFYKKIIFFAS